MLFRLLFCFCFGLFVVIIFRGEGWGREGVVFVVFEVVGFVFCLVVRINYFLFYFLVKLFVDLIVLEIVWNFSVSRV